MNDVKNRLKQLLTWSDRLGSDEIEEIKEIISMIKDEENGKSKQHQTVKDLI